MGLSMVDIEECFKEARLNKSEYIGVMIEMDGFPEPEVIINPCDNFDAKLAYYKKAYSDSLVLKTFSGIRIRDIAFGDSYDEIEIALLDE